MKEFVRYGVRPRRTVLHAEDQPLELGATGHCGVSVHPPLMKVILQHLIRQAAERRGRTPDVLAVVP
eukprot:782314-Prorocentrum_lima.AAC.1